MFRLSTIMFMLCLASVHGQESPRIDIDATAMPASEPWLAKGAALAGEWYPRLHNLLAAGGDQVPTKPVVLRVKVAADGVAHTSNGVITVMSGWITNNPGDLGLVVHELTHVVQAYPHGAEFWITEGIADYTRWAIYEGKPLSWYPRGRQSDGYKEGYRVAAGFLLWLESGQAPGIVRRLNGCLRAGQYRPEVFAQWTGKSLDTLWAEYSAARASKG